MAESSEGSEIDEEINKTILPSDQNASVNMEEEVENMKKQMEELLKNLDEERKERQKLSELLMAREAALLNPSTPAFTPQTVVTNSEIITSGTSQQNPSNQHQPTTVLSKLIASPSSQNQSMPSTSFQSFSPAYSLGTTSLSYAVSNSNIANVNQPIGTYVTNSPYVASTSIQPSMGATKKIYDLPKFCGKPEEWPSFSVAFRESTANMCYSNWENHLRLTKALIGEAKESVAALLIHPENVNNVIAELERQYGQNEQLLRSQLEKVKKLQAIPENRLDLLIPFATKVRNLAAFLESINSLPHLANPNLIDELVKILPTSKMVNWGMYAISIKPYVTVRNFSDWLSNLAHVVSLVNVTNPVIQESRKFSKPKGVLHVKEIAKRDYKCTLCKGGHQLSNCVQFQRMDLNEKWLFVKNGHLCFSCLRYGHSTLNCRSKKPCNISGCKRSHNPLLHDDNSNSSQVPVNIPNTEPQQHLLLSRQNCQQVEVLYKILPVMLYGPNGSSIEVYAMIDEGSSITLLEEDVLRKLNVHGTPQKLHLKWFGNKTSAEESEVIDLEISGCSPGSMRYPLKDVRTVKNIDLPVQTMQMSQICEKYHTLKKLPIRQYENAKPLILIGLDNSLLATPTNTTCTTSSGPIAIKTRLGWLVYGPYESTRVTEKYALHIRTPASHDEQLERIIDDFFTVESLGIKISNTVESTSDLKAKEILCSTTKKIGDQYQTGLLWKDPDIKLPPSFEMAKGRLLSMERKMCADPIFKERYIEMVQSFINKGYARKLNPKEAALSTKVTWYLPHFLASNPNKPGKYRLVFDAAAKAGGVSLNDNLLKGPDMYNSLVSVLFNFRSKEVAVCADIKEMFSQIRIQPSDVHAQRFLWRDGDSSKPIDIYVMDAMTFGVTCSPASAHHIKNFNALSYSESNPEAVESILHHHYVDDYIDSFHSVEEAKRISSDVSSIHAKAGFTLRGFISNESDVANYLNECSNVDPVPDSIKTLNLEESTTEKILGLIWDTKDDSFKFNIKFNKVSPDVINNKRRPSKRELLSILMSIFDPLGFLSNITIYPKILMQELWRRHLDWDEAVPNDISNQWLQWKESLEKVKSFKLPRYYFAGVSNVVDLQLHTFVDASQDAFAAVTYLRINDGVKISACLVSSKTKCAPIKKLMSIPRLELQAAVIGARICEVIVKGHNFDVSARVFWSDSATVIHWIKSDNRRYKPYVAHRVSEILETTKTYEWRWVSTKLNIADKATRATYPINYDPQSPWVSGPNFLLSEEKDWPNNSPQTNIECNEEVRRKHVFATQEITPWIDTARFSRYSKLKRVVAWVQRFINNKFKLSERQTGELTARELQQSEIKICALVQKEEFNKEIQELKNKSRVAETSPIYRLCPIISDDGLLRLNGRIGKSDVIPTCTKRPIIMPKKHPITKLIVKHYHCLMFHQNRNTIISEIQRKFWIPNVKSVVNQVRVECQTCKNRSTKANPPKMGDLPFDRVTAFIRPFTYTGVDYFGPYEVSIGRRREKRWVALFTCLTVRAVHLELAADMSTDAFLVCVRNFVNRRGVPMRIRSDNGTNFVGAAKEINEAIDNLDNDRIRSQLATQNIEWVFNCPDNPHAGGCWERMVQSVKRVLSYTLLSEAPRIETLQSLLIEAENIVNCRPLTDIPLSHEDDEALTPNHFLVGCANSTQTPGPTDAKIWTMRKQWRISQQLKNRFWKKWVGEYLPSIIRRSKWNDVVKPISVGDLVLIIDPAIARNKWSKGRVIEVFAGADGQVRTAKVKTSTGELKRPAVKLAVLDVKNDSESSELIQIIQDDSRGEV